MKSVAIIGRGRLGVFALTSALAAGYQVRRVVTNKVEPAWDDSLSDKVRRHFPRIPVDRSGDWRSLIGLDVDLILSVMYDRIIGRELLGYLATARPVDRRTAESDEFPCRRGAGESPAGPAPQSPCPRVLNLHLGKLPEYRGMRPINWALKNGEAIAGVTLHEVDEGIDTGPIVAQTTFSIFPEVDEVRDVYRRAVTAGIEILRETLPIVDRIKAVPQDETRAGYYNTADMARLGDRLDWTRESS